MHLCMRASPPGAVSVYTQKGYRDIGNFEVDDFPDGIPATLVFFRMAVTSSR